MNVRTQKSLLYWHKKKHLGLNKTICDYNECNLSFETELKRHNRSVHMKEKPFKPYYNSCSEPTLEYSSQKYQKF